LLYHICKPAVVRSSAKGRRKSPLNFFTRQNNNLVDKPEQRQRVIAYIDGFNLFYSSLKGTKFKWLDIWSICSSFLRPSQELVKVKYFSAHIGAVCSNPDKPFRQKIYLEALQTNPRLEVKLGYFPTIVIWRMRYR